MTDLERRRAALDKLEQQWQADKRADDLKQWIKRSRKVRALSQAMYKSELCGLIADVHSGKVTSDAFFERVNHIYSKRGVA